MKKEMVFLLAACGAAVAAACAGGVNPAGPQCGGQCAPSAATGAAMGVASDAARQPATDAPHFTRAAAAVAGPVVEANGATVAAAAGRRWMPRPRA
jgi:hypothetical protein